MEIDTNLDVATAWTIEAAAFLVAGLCFLAWSMAVRNPWGSLVAFAIEVAVCLGAERLLKTLPRADRLTDASPLSGSSGPSPCAVSATWSGATVWSTTCAPARRGSTPTGTTSPRRSLARPWR